MTEIKVNVTGEVSDYSSEVEKVSQAVAQAGDFKQPKLTAKQAEKQAKKEKEYWNGMMTRGEVHTVLTDFSDGVNQKLQTLYIQNATLLKVLEDKGIITAEELEATGKIIIEELFGPMPEQPSAEHTVAEAPTTEG